MTKQRDITVELSEFMAIHNYFAKLDNPKSETAREIIAAIEDRILGLVPTINIHTKDH